MCVLEVRVQNLGGQGCVTVDVADLQFVAILAFEVHTIGWSCKVKRYYFINVTYQLRQNWRFGLVVWSWQYGLLCVCVFCIFSVHIFILTKEQNMMLIHVINLQFILYHYQKVIETRLVLNSCRTHAEFMLISFSP